MHLEVPDDIVRHAEVNASDLLIAMAVQLYADNRIDHTDACRLSGLSLDEMNRELVDRDITIQLYPPAASGRREAG